ncbi:MAG: hypothetical protein ABSB22_04415, partial [Thermodesulfobacteriota bacterium]
EAQQLPFNVAGLDTVKYTNENFEGKAIKALDAAITATTQESTPSFGPDQILEAFLLLKRMLIVPLTSEGDRNFYEIGRPLGFNLIMSFDAMKYAYFGNFTALRPETVIWRLRTLEDIIQERIASVPDRVELGLATREAMDALRRFIENFKAVVLVTSDEDRMIIQNALTDKPSRWPVEVYALSDTVVALQTIG